MFHYHHIQLVRLSIRDMLKGLKKIQKDKEKEDAVEVSTVRATVNVNQLKEEAIMEEEERIEENRNDVVGEAVDKDDLKLYQECYELFLQGNSELLEQKLQIVNKPKAQSKMIDESARNNFDYNLNFDDQNDKATLKKRNKPIMASNRISEYCIFCPDNEQLELLSASNYVYLALAKYKTFKNYYHLILAPVDHQQTMIGLNQDILTEINNYKKCLLQAFDKMGLQVIFFEQYSKENSHIYIQCLALNYGKAQDLPFFFKQALEDIEGNWTTHKSIMKIEKEKGGIQKQIPKPIKYFYIDFSVGYGYAHVIENEKFWKRQFCYEVLATAMGMQTHSVKSTQEYTPEQITLKKQNFNKIWKNYDWTTLI